jgi:hypothetical protein
MNRSDIEVDQQINSDINDYINNNEKTKKCENWDKYLYTICLFLNHLAFVSILLTIKLILIKLNCFLKFFLGFDECFIRANNG